MRMDMELDHGIEYALDEIDQDLETLESMLESLDPVKTDWNQIHEYLSWVRIKMIDTYELTGEKRMFHQIKKVEALLDRAKQRQDDAHGV